MNLTVDEALDDLIHDLRIGYVEIYLRRAEGIYYRGAAGEFIFIECSLETKEKVWAKAHELGHAMTGQTTATCESERRSNERRADRYAYSLLMPPKRILDAHQCGIDTEEDLSDFLMIPVDRIMRGLMLYQDEVYGPEYSCGDWRIRWMPITVWKPGGEGTRTVPVFSLSDLGQRAM